jgi:hypothetical protein
MWRTKIELEWIKLTVFDLRKEIGEQKSIRFEEKDRDMRNKQKFFLYKSERKHIHQTTFDT